MVPEPQLIGFVDVIGARFPLPELRLPWHTKVVALSCGVNVPVTSSAPVYDMIPHTPQVGVAERLQVTVSEETAAVVWQSHSLSPTPEGMANSSLAAASQVNPPAVGAV